MGKVLYFLLAPALVFILLQTATAADPGDEPQQFSANYQKGSINGIDYISGGVGLDERNALAEAAKNQYNVKVEFAVKARNYLTDIPVEISGKSGKVVMKVNIEGPLFYVKLPAGSYTIKAQYEGKTVARKVIAGKGLQKTVFIW